MCEVAGCGQVKGSHRVFCSASCMNGAASSSASSSSGTATDIVDKSLAETASSSSASGTQAKAKMVKQANPFKGQVAAARFALQCMKVEVEAEHVLNGWLVNYSGYTGKPSAPWPTLIETIYKHYRWQTINYSLQGNYYQEILDPIQKSLSANIPVIACLASPPVPKVARLRHAVCIVGIDSRAQVISFKDPLLGDAVQKQEFGGKNAGDDFFKLFSVQRMMNGKSESITLACQDLLFAVKSERYSEYMNQLVIDLPTVLMALIRDYVGADLQWAPSALSASVSSLPSSGALLQAAHSLVLTNGKKYRDKHRAIENAPAMVAVMFDPLIGKKGAWFGGLTGEKNQSQGFIPTQIWDRIPSAIDVQKYAFGRTCAEVQCLRQAYAARSPENRAVGLAGAVFAAYSPLEGKIRRPCNACQGWISQSGAKALQD